MLFISLIRTTFVLKDSIKYSSFLRYLQFAKNFDFGPLNSHLRNIWPQLLLDEIKSSEISLSFSMTYYKILKVKHTSLKKTFDPLVIFVSEDRRFCTMFVQKLARNFLLFSSLCSVATQFEKIRHFEKKIQSALNLGPNQRTLKIFLKCVKFGTKSTHFENFFKVCEIWDQHNDFFFKMRWLGPKVNAL